MISERASREPLSEYIQDLNLDERFDEFMPGLTWVTGPEIGSVKTLNLSTEAGVSWYAWHWAECIYSLTTGGTGRPRSFVPALRKSVGSNELGLPVLILVEEFCSRGTV